MPIKIVARPMQTSKKRISKSRKEHISKVAVEMDEAPAHIEEVLPFSKLKDKEISAMLAKYNIGLTVDEAKKICRILKRDPTLTEAVIWGIQGSEHSSYKSSKRHLKMLPTDAPNVILGPCEDAGIVELVKDGRKRFGIVMGHESHNHSSQRASH